jgi:hypothetical protein
MFGRKKSKQSTGTNDSTDATEVSQQKAPDFSLRPSADTYVDQKEESQKILRRIETSSALVMGIAGVRGAGKSSIALKVLSGCEAKGYFTLLIHSPAGYEHREFLLSIFQRLCEATIERVEKLLEQASTLQERGLNEAKKINRIFRLILLGGLCTILIPAAITYYRYLKTVEAKQQVYASRVASINQDINNRISNLNNRDNDLLKEQQDVERKLASYGVPLTMFDGRRPDKIEERIDLFISEVESGASEQLSKTALAQLRKNLDDVINASKNYLVIQRQREQLADEISRFEKRKEDPLDRYRFSIDDLSDTPTQPYISLGVTTVLGLFFYVGVAFTWIGARRMRRRYTIHIKHAKEVGLYSLAKETLEHLNYQATVTTSEDASLNLWKLSGKLLRSKSLATRPISLPGVTADCNAFLDKMAEVFGEKCVVCLDELDKINDPEQLAELLKGVKGILGQRRTYFLLTVSEDALARFTTRRRAERDIIESSFDEILYLNRVNHTLSQNIVEQMLAVDNKEHSAQFINNSILVWLFAGGIPREIKRNVILCSTNNLNLLEADYFEVWKVLFKDLLESQESWALVLSKENDISYQFLRGLDDTIQKLPNKLMSGQEVISWYRDMIAGWSAYYKLPFFKLEDGVSEATSGDAEGTQPLFERGVFELAIGAVALLIVANREDGDESDDYLKELLEIFTLLSYSLSYAGYKFNQLLERMGVIKQSDTNSVVKETVSTLPAQ